MFTFPSLLVGPTQHIKLEIALPLCSAYACGPRDSTRYEIFEVKCLIELQTSSHSYTSKDERTGSTAVAEKGGSSGSETDDSEIDLDSVDTPPIIPPATVLETSTKTCEVRNG